MATILVVDDNAVNRKLLVALLSGDGHLTVEASDGLEGLKLAREHRPQLVISDIVMPTMDGYGFVRALRLDPQLCSTPVIFFTAHYHEREAQKLAQACGVSRVVVKPSPAADLLKTVEQVMAGVCESDPDPLPDNFDREHLRLVTNKLTERTGALAAFHSRFEALAKLNREFAAVQDPHALLERVCSDARNLFGAVYAVIAVTENMGGGGVFFSTCGIDFGGTSAATPALDSGPLAAVLASRSPWRAADQAGKSVDSGLPKDYPAAQAVLAVPLLTSTQAYGCLCLVDKIGADEFDVEDEELLFHMGMLVGRTYQNLTLRLALKLQAEQLHRSKQQSQQLAEAWARNVNRVYAILGGANSLITSARSRDELCKAACRLAILHGKFRLAFIEMLDSVSGAMSLVAAAGDAKGAVDLARRMSTAPSEEDDLLTEALSLGRPAMCNELQSPHPPVRMRGEMLSRGYRAIAALPMGTGTAPIGRLVLLSEKPQFFDDDEMRLQTALAGHIALAISRRAGRPTQSTMNHNG